MHSFRIAAFAATALIGAPASGQAAGEDAIVVTGRGFVEDTASATKTRTPIIETPQAVSLVDSGFIDALNVRTIAEALNYSSGVRSQAFGSDTRIDYYQLRGFANQSFFKDGLVLFNAGAFLSWSTPAEGVGRLEVVKGPSSVLYGGGGAGGLVNIVSKPAIRRTTATVEIGADEYGSAYGSADLGGAVADTLAVRAVGLVRRGDTQVELAEDNRTYASLALGWTPTDDTSLTLRGSLTRDRSNRPTGFLPYAGFVTPLADGRRIPVDLFVSDPSVDRYDRDQRELGYGFETRLGDALRFNSNGRYARIDLTYAGLFGAFAGNPVLAGGRYLLNRGNSRQDAFLDNVTIDNNLSGDGTVGGLRHTLLAGLDYSFSSTRSDQRMGTAPRLDIFDPRYGVPIAVLGAASTTRQKLDQTGVYLQDQIKAGRFVALLSARRDRLGITAVNAAGVVATGSPARTTYRAGLVHLSANGFAPYLNHATSFAPVIGVEAATGASLFTIDRDGVLVANPVAGFPTNQSQLGLQRSRGGELEVKARPLPTLDITAALTAFSLRNRRGPAASLGKSPTATPGFTASAFVDYIAPAGTLLDGLGLGGGVRHVGRSFADAANMLVVPAATVFDLAVRYDVGQFRAALNVSNLLDRAYVAACPSAGTCYSANLRRATFSLSHRL